MLEMNANIGLLLNTGTKDTKKNNNDKEYDPMDFGRSRNSKDTKETTSKNVLAEIDKTLR